MKKLRISNTTKALLASALFTANIAYADITSGMATAATELTNLQTGLFTAAAIVAIIYLIWVGLMAKTEKKSWADFGWAIVHVSVVGAAVAIATWAWTAFA